MIVMAHFSDVHIDGGERSAERARRVVDHIAALPRPVDAVLLTGDIADHGTPEEYAAAAEILSAVPALMCPGNHDAREPYRRVLLGEEAAPGPVNRAHEIGGATFAMCDSSIPGRDDGYLDDETLAWLDGVLAGGDGPAFVCFHHPPASLHVPFIDEIMLGGADRLAAVLARHPRVAAVLTGHAHTPAATTFAGLPLLVAPGVVSTLKTPWESGPFLNPDLPPMLAFHVLDDDGRLTTHFRVVP
ncbi:metallophosphoesterase [Bailinhaonella thermotolerans]|uniref:Phosphodiesterase n=1 Tax=Bailinhaonella thermotolerans TaxID=1070861 RepID=A0A3A4B763_9ACTN|nr:metallophosphoesterase [Bailinhaonella thermotolerans]RJL34061.1 phosphodiesterase [Bailinhaonella thermotolerans]